MLITAEICLWHFNLSNFIYSVADHFWVVLRQLNEVSCLQIWLTSLFLESSSMLSEIFIVNNITKIRADLLTWHILWLSIYELFSSNYMKFHVFAFNLYNYIFLSYSSMSLEIVHFGSITEMHVYLWHHKHLQFASKPDSPIPSAW